MKSLLYSTQTLPTLPELYPQLLSLLLKLITLRPAMVRYSQLASTLERLTLSSEVDETASIATPSSTTATKKDYSLEFFSRFPNFEQNTDNPISVEFYRLANHRGWRAGSKKWKKNWNVCMAQQFDLVIGQRDRDINTWRKMCEKLEIPGKFPSITQCKKVCLKPGVSIPRHP